MLHIFISQIRFVYLLLLQIPSGIAVSGHSEKSPVYMHNMTGMIDIIKHWNVVKFTYPIQWTLV